MASVIALCVMFCSLLFVLGLMLRFIESALDWVRPVAKGGGFVMTVVGQVWRGLFGAMRYAAQVRPRRISSRARGRSIRQRGREIGGS